MTNSSDIKPAKTEVSWWGKNLTIQNVFTATVTIGFITGFYFKTQSNIDQLQENQRQQSKESLYHTDWLFQLSLKTGVSPPPRDQSK